MGAQDKKNVKRHRRHNLKERFEILKTLGQGTYGKVKLAIEKATGTKVFAFYLIVFYRHLCVFTPTVSNLCSVL